MYKGAADFTVAVLHDDPSASARETIYHFTEAVGRHRRRPRAGRGVLRRGSVHHRVVHEEQVAYIREKETEVYEHVRDVIDRGIASGESMTATSTAGAGLHRNDAGAYRWLRPQGRRTAQEIVVEFSTALLRGSHTYEAVGRIRRWVWAWPWAHSNAVGQKTVEVEASAESIMAIVADFEL